MRGDEPGQISPTAQEADGSGRSRASASRQISKELGQLRGLSGPLDVLKITHARALLKAFGGDEPEIALKRFVDLANEHIEDREVQAAMASFGWGVSGESALDRLSEFSERFFVDPRTVRRWSDAGIRKLATLIVGSSPWLQPRARLFVVVEEDEVRIALDLRIPAGLRMSQPHLSLDSEPIDLLLAPIEAAPQPRRLASGLRPVATTNLLPMSLRLSWMGEKFPRYEAITRGVPEVSFSSRVVFTSLKVDVRPFPRRLLD